MTKGHQRRATILRRESAKPAEDSRTPKAGGVSACRLSSAVAIGVALLLWLIPAGPATAQAPDPSEATAFNAAARAFRNMIYERARNEFREFVQRFPNSPKVPEALLLQARAALELGDSKAAVNILTTNLPNAGIFAEDYHYWLGEVQLQTGNHRGAANSFARLLKDFPETARALEASYNQALAHFNLKEWNRVIELLQNPGTPFQKVAWSRPDDDLVVGGYLLLAEALMEKGTLPDAEKILLGLPAARLAADLKWQREYLLCRIQLGEGRLQSALGASSNLVALADSNALPKRRAESVALLGGILQQLNDLPGAATAYEQNLRKEIPVERRKQALLKIVEITLAQDSVDLAVQKLEKLLADHPAEAGSDFAMLTLGELRLKQHLSQASALPAGTNGVLGPTNALQLAQLQFDLLLTNAPNSPFIGKALLNRGWCLWISGKTNESAIAFKAAAENLSHSEDQAVARFKLGDALLAAKDHLNALQNFERVVADYDDLPNVQQSIVPQALYHVVRCSIELNNLRQADNAMRQILRAYPRSPFAEKSMLLVGQRYSEMQKPAVARKLFAEFRRQFPSSSLLPEVELALARSYREENDWDRAAKRYDDWVAQYPSNELRGRAEFYRAVAHDKAGRDKIAFLQFTNFLAQFPTNDLAPLAQHWVADYYYRQSDFQNAERNYQGLFQNTNWPVTELTYQAWMDAGRAAAARDNYKDAADYYSRLIENKSCPSNLLAEAFYALGDAMISRQDSAPGATALSKYSEAKAAFERLPTQYPTHDLVPRAWGRIGDCNLQMASAYVKYYQEALDAYQKAMSHEKADITVRSLAEMGLGAVLEAQAKLNTTTDGDSLLKAAFDHYYNIVSGKNLGGEKLDVYYYTKAALAAARLAEERKEWKVAIQIYSDLLGVVPSARPTVQRKLERAQEQLLPETNGTK